MHLYTYELTQLITQHVQVIGKKKTKGEERGRTVKGKEGVKRRCNAIEGLKNKEDWQGEQRRKREYWEMRVKKRWGDGRGGIEGNGGKEVSEGAVQIRPAVVSVIVICRN